MYPFFVYGTLLPGQRYFKLWQGSIREIKSAYLLNCRLIDMGRYPMLVEEGADIVKGKAVYLFKNAYKPTMAKLDALEEYDPEQPENGSYRRVIRAVRLSSGENIEAWVYIGRTSLASGKKVIESGDWQAYSNNKMSDKSRI